MRATLKKQASHLFVVDLDDTLIKTDLIFEKLYLLIRNQPLLLLQLPLVLCKGRLFFKHWLAEKVTLKPADLPYRAEVLERVRKAKEAGHWTMLLSASLQSEVDGIARHLKIFDEAIGSTDKNLKGETKLATLRARYPHTEFSYVGDGASDLYLWKEAQHAIAVNPAASTLRKLTKASPTAEVLRDREGLWTLTLRQIRVYQWPKNVLVFIPLLAAHSFDEGRIFWHALQAFSAFSLLASAVYLFNDLCDLEADRKHHSKKERPLASGKFPLSLAMALIPLCLLGTLLASVDLPWRLWLVLAVYLVANIAYSFFAKEWLAIDVVILASFYTLRILAGGMATGIPVSEWLLSFSVFFFFGLAMVKRLTELKALSLRATEKGARRAYLLEDQMAVLCCGLTSSFLSILVLATYLSTGEVKRLYSHPVYLWLVTPCLLYWLTRVWLLANRGVVDDDPVIFAFHDRVTWCVGLTCAAILVLAI